MQQTFHPVYSISSPSSSATETLLLIEDNPDDIFLMRRALKKSGIEFPVQIVTNGKQALDYLSGSDHYADRRHYPLPAWVFLAICSRCRSAFRSLA